MRSLSALLTTLGLLACGTPPATPERPADLAAPANPTIDYLLTSAAADFHAHRPPELAGFRDVRSGYVTAPDGKKEYMLCGQFRSTPEGGTAEWAPFATIRTSGYEQYVGGQGESLSFCTRPATTWDEGDLSSTLQDRLDSVRASAGDRPAGGAGQDSM